LESFGHSREADKTFRIVVAGFVEAKLFKDAFLVMLTRFEILMRREALAKATLVCKEALATLQKTDGLGFPAQLENLWLNLMARAAARRLTAHQIQEARRFLVQQWTASSPIPLPVINDNNAPENSSLVARPSSKAPAVHSDMSGSREFSVERTTPWAHFGLALHQYDRALICVGLAQCGGRVREAARLLGISRNTLRTKIAKYGLSSGTSTFQQPSAGIARPMLLNDEEKDLLLQLRTRAWRRELKSLNTAEQFRRIKAVLFLQTREMFAALIDEASSTSLTNPAAGEKMARVAYALAELISPTRVTPRERNDLRAKGLLVIGNCRRLAGDWRHSIATLNTANRHLDRGTEDPQLRARLLSVQASLASDMGNREKALSLLEHASSIYRRIRDIAGVAFIAVQEANVLLAAYHHENAIAKAEETLTVLTNKEARLAHLARNIIIESLVFLGRPIDALRKVQAERRSHDKFGGQRAELRLAHLEALILDSLGLSQEAESIFRSNVEGFMESGLCKDAFLVLLTRFELLYQRGELDRAARACDDAIKWMEGTKEGRHAEAIRLFRNLLSLMTARALTANHLLRARQVLADSWNGTSTTEDEPTPSQKEASAIIYEESRPVRAPEPPPVPSHLTAGDYEKALEHYERHLITAALARCQGHLSETCRLLGISRNTLKSRMKQYGLPTSNAS
jgi:DNA-binding protein Fis